MFLSFCLNSLWKITPHYHHPAFLSTRNSVGDIRNKGARLNFIEIMIKMKKRKREKKTSSRTTCTRKLEVLATAWWTCNQKKLSTSVCVRERTLNTQEYNEGCFINTYRNTTFRSVLPLARVYMPRARGLKMQTQCVPWLSVANGCAHGLGHLRHSIQAIHTVDNQTKWRQKKKQWKIILQDCCMSHTCTDHSDVSGKKRTVILIFCIVHRVPALQSVDLQRDTFLNKINERKMQNNKFTKIV